MPRAVKKLTTETKEPIKTRIKIPIEFSLQKFFQDSKSYTPILIVLLLVASFLLGALTTKLATSQNSTGNPQTATQPNTPAAAPNVPNQQAPAGKIKPVTDKDHIRGNKNAKVAIVEYSDLECPFCQRFHPTMKEILQTYGDKVNWVYRHFPLSFHANAQKESEATECVAELGGNDAFWNYVDKIFERTTSNGTGFALDKLGPLAAEVGVNQGQFQSCFDSGKYTKLVEEQIADGTQAGVSGTPSTFVNGQIVVGAQSFASFKTIIDQELSK